MTSISDCSSHKATVWCRVTLEYVEYSAYTLKNKGASKGSSSDAIEEPFFGTTKNHIQSKVL